MYFTSIVKELQKHKGNSPIDTSDSTIKDVSLKIYILNAS